MNSEISKIIIGWGAKWFAKTILKKETEVVKEVLENVGEPSKPLDIDYYKKTFRDPSFQQKFETLKDNIPELLMEFAINHSWFSIPRVEEMLDFVTDKTNKVILTEPVEALTDLEKVHSSIWGERSNISPLGKVDTRVQLEIIDINLEKQEAKFKHNAYKFWTDETELKKKQKEEGKKLAPWILCAILEYEPSKWYAISFESIAGGKWKNIGRVLRGGPTNNPQEKYAPKRDQLVGFWIQPAFDIDQGMSEVTWIKLIQ